jgi:pimeloyl-ACP methyl ester carboxylesterase
LSVLVGGVFAENWGDNADFVEAGKLVKAVPYNPRPIATNSADITGMSEFDSRVDFLDTFERVQFDAPANGRTFESSDPLNNAPDITLVGYLPQVPHPADRPWIILTHGGSGGSSIVRGSFQIDIANVLFANGYNVLAFDRRDGLLTRCAYDESGAPDASRSTPASFGGYPAQFCGGQVGGEFRDPDHNPNSLITGFGAFGAGDVLAAAQYLKDVHGAQKIGVFTGSRGGIPVILAAAIQDDPGHDFDAGLLDALLVFSPSGDDNTQRYARPDASFSSTCLRVSAADFYSGIEGSGIRDFTPDPVGAVEDLFGLLNGVKNIERVTIPVLIIHTMTDNILFIDGALAYKAKTDEMKLGDTIIMTRLGHYQDTWQSDPFWADKVVLTYFKRLLAKDISGIGDYPGFDSAGPSLNNPLIVDLKFKKEDADKFVVQERIVSFFNASLIPGLPGYCNIAP